MGTSFQDVSLDLEKMQVVEVLAPSIPLCREDVDRLVVRGEGMGRYLYCQRN